MLEHMPYRRPAKQPLPKRQALFYEKILEFANLVGMVLIFDYGLDPAGASLSMILLGLAGFLLFYGVIWYSMNKFY